MATERIRIRTKLLGLSKVVHNAQFQVKTVLTLEPFDYVDLWLRRQHKDEALFYWRQARDFHRASIGLPMESAPLVLYYCFMNAAKALLASKGVTFNPHHGVGPHRMRGQNSKVVLSNEGIAIRPNGIVPALAGYFGEAEPSQTHSLEDVLYNLVFVHRTYCLSYPNKKERFLPLKNLAFVRDSDTNEVRFTADVVDDADWKFFRKQLPPEVTAAQGGSATINSIRTIVWASLDKPNEAELEDLRQLNEELRRVLHYINGAHTLWYLKSTGTYEIDRRPITLTLAAMHRLSEICRYKPSELRSFLDGQKNWLLSEFVAMAPAQFLDEIACEMTGHQIMIPNVRTPV
ncbi:YaaC family protein [Shinella pollutisoli]|uniref:YaaC family protein n=1 Tax=Shinella pollutisoli TaxID=2250594 RepID=A0ABV7DLP5_9HYPH